VEIAEEANGEARVCGGEVLYAADLAPKNQKHPRPRAPERREVATRSRVDGGEEPDHDGESSREACGRRGGPKTRRSTTQEAHEQKQPPTTRDGDIGKDLNKPARS